MGKILGIAFGISVFFFFGIALAQEAPKGAVVDSKTVGASKCDAAMVAFENEIATSCSLESFHKLEAVCHDECSGAAESSQICEGNLAAVKREISELCAKTGEALAAPVKVKKPKPPVCEGSAKLDSKKKVCVCPPESGLRPVLVGYRHWDCAATSMAAGYLRDAFLRDLEAALKPINDRLAALEKRLDETCKPAETLLPADKDTSVAECSRLEGEINALKQKIDDPRDGLDSIASRVRVLETQVSELSGIMGKFFERLKAAEDKLKKHEGRIDVLEQKTPSFGSKERPIAIAIAPFFEVATPFGTDPYAALVFGGEAELGIRSGWGKYLIRGIVGGARYGDWVLNVGGGLGVSINLTRKLHLNLLAEANSAFITGNQIQPVPAGTPPTLRGLSVGGSIEIEYCPAERVCLRGGVRPEGVISAWDGTTMSQGQGAGMALNFAIPIWLLK